MHENLPDHPESRGDFHIGIVEINCLGGLEKMNQRKKESDKEQGDECPAASQDCVKQQPTEDPFLEQANDDCRCHELSGHAEIKPVLALKKSQGEISAAKDQQQSSREKKSSKKMGFPEEVYL